MTHKSSIKDLYPDFSDEELAEADANIEAFVRVVMRIHERLRAEGKEWPPEDEFVQELTDDDRSSTMPIQRSNSPM